MTNSAGVTAVERQIKCLVCDGPVLPVCDLCAAKEAVRTGAPPPHSQASEGIVERLRGIRDWLGPNGDQVTIALCEEAAAALSRQAPQPAPEDYNRTQRRDGTWASDEQTEARIAAGEADK